MSSVFRTLIFPYICGKHSLEGVTVAELDKSRKPIPGTEEYIECDLLVLAVGLIPENELSVNAGIELDPKTKGPILDDDYMTCIPGIFAAGNVSVVFDLVDYVSESGRIAAKGAIKYLRGEIPKDLKYNDVECGNNVNFVVPQRVKYSDSEKSVMFFMRVKEPHKKATLTCESSGDEILRKKYQVVAPPEMLACKAQVSGMGNVKLSIEGGN